MFSELPLTFQAELSLILNKHVLEKVYSSLRNTYSGSYDLNIYDEAFLRKYLTTFTAPSLMFDRVLTL